MGRRPRVDRTPEEKWQIVQEGIKERERLGDVPAAWHFTVTAISMEGRSGGGSKGSAWGEKRCRRRNREGPAHSAAGTDAGAKISRD